MNLRELITTWIRTNGAGHYWTMNVYLYMIAHGALPDDAIKALSLFVDEAITKVRPMELG